MAIIDRTAVDLQRLCRMSGGGSVHSRDGCAACRAQTDFGDGVLDIGKRLRATMEAGLPRVVKAGWSFRAPLRLGEDLWQRPGLVRARFPKIAAPGWH
ncbi:hypothetical protein AJ87_23890 [Rhizobium yanglingense]|nr:hypothetical protein AJ87_23890 [Rhizobium yanglingense]